MDTPVTSFYKEDNGLRFKRGRLMVMTEAAVAPMKVAEVTGIGPLGLEHVNRKDDPRNGNSVR